MWGAPSPSPAVGAGMRDTTVELSPGEPIGGAVRLWVETGSYGSAPFAVTLAPGGELVLGSAEAASVPIDDVTVSARHCRVTHAGVSIEVADLGARNGLRVGGVRVPRASLALGGTFEIGRTLIRVQP